MAKKFVKKTREDIIFDACIAVVMAVVTFVCVYPFYFAVVLSFNDGVDAARGGIYFWPRSFTLDNYKTFFTDARWLQGFAVSAVRTIIGTVATTLFTAVVAYGLSFKELLFRKFYIGLTIFCMYFSGGLIPYYVTLKAVGLLNSFWVYIVPQALNLFYVIVAISFFQEIPAELHESAKLDGAGEATVLLQIILPISLPLLATIAIFTGVAHWSAWFDSAFYVQDSRLRTLGYLLMEVINKANPNGALQQLASAQNAVQVTPLSIQTTAMVIAVLPIMLIYPFLQKYFVTGLTVGSVKG